MRVLVVDDFPGAAEAACVVIRLLGHDALEALTGRDAIAKAKTFQPDIVLLDIGLPDLSGYEVAAILRAQDGGDGLHLVAMSGWDQLRAPANAPRIDQSVAKPIDGKRLRELVVQACADLQQRQLAVAS